MELSQLWKEPSPLTDIDSDGKNQEDKVIAFLEAIKDFQAPYDERIEAVRRCLYRTSSDMIRNQAALALVDLISRDAARDIVHVLRKRTIAGSSGTLLFALNEIGADFPIDILARTVADGSYEAQNEAMFALEQNRVAPAEDGAEERVIADITPLLTSDDGATAELAESLLAHIERGKLADFGR